MLKRPPYLRKQSLFDRSQLHHFQSQLGESPFVDLETSQSSPGPEPKPEPKATPVLQEIQNLQEPPKSSTTESYQPTLPKVHSVRPSRAASFLVMPHFEKPLPEPTPYYQGFKVGYRAGFEVGAKDKEKGHSNPFTPKDSSCTRNQFLQASKTHSSEAMIEMPRRVAEKGKWGGRLAEGFEEGWSRGYWNGLKIGLGYENKQRWEERIMVEKAKRFRIDLVCDCCGPNVEDEGQSNGLVERSGNRVKGV